MIKAPKNVRVKPGDLVRMLGHYEKTINPIGIVLKVSERSGSDDSIWSLPDIPHKDMVWDIDVLCVNGKIYDWETDAIELLTSS